MKKVLLFAVVFLVACGLMLSVLHGQPKQGLSAIQRTGYGECWRPSTRLGISADYNVNNMFSITICSAIIHRVSSKSII